jgi:hypothetical protein
MQVFYGKDYLSHVKSTYFLIHRSIPRQVVEEFSSRIEIHYKMKIISLKDKTLNLQIKKPHET